MATQQASSPESILKNIHIGIPVYCCTEEDATALRAKELDDVRICDTNGCDNIGYNEYAVVSTLIAECPLSKKKRTDLVLKKFQRDFLDFTKPHSIKYSAREVVINLGLRHDNIGSAEGIYVQQKNSTYLITGLVFEHHGTELRHYMAEGRDKNGIITTSTIVKIATQIASALQFMHDQDSPVIHRDVKPDNILVSERDGYPYVKLIDYGHSRTTADLMTANLTEHYYTAPEIFVTEREETIYTTAVDIYSFGMVMYFMTVGKNPFERERTNKEGMTRIRDFGNYINSSIGDGIYPRPEFHAVYVYPQILKQLIEDCWKHTPQERLGWDQINDILMKLEILRNIKIGRPVYCSTEEDATALRAKELDDVRICNTNGCDYIGYTEYAVVSTLIAECPLSNAMRTDLVLKKFQKQYSDFTKPHFIKYSEREVELNLRLHHDNIGFPEGIYVQKQKNNAYLITGLVFEHHGIELRHYIADARDNNGIINTSTIVEIATQIASALQFMHDQAPPVIHRDVKPNKILVSERDGYLHVKLIGFKLSCVVADLMTANLTYHSYTAPEMFATEREETIYTTTVDIYSFGMVMYFMTVGKNPFERTNKKGITRIRDFGKFINSPNKDGNYPRPEFHPTYGYPESLKQLIEDCWKHTPEERLRWDQINDILKELAATPE